MSQTALEKLEQAKQRVERASTARQRIQVKLEAARQQYAEAVREAETAYGTADLDKLRALLMKQEADNAKAVEEFVSAVDDFERFISRIETALADPEAMSALLASMPPVVAVEPVAAAPAAPTKSSVVFNEDDI